MDVSDNSEPPVTCPWRGNLFLSDDEPDDANWQELKEDEYMKKETEKERVDRRMKSSFEHHGVCAGCAGQCDGCKDASGFSLSDRFVQDRLFAIEAGEHGDASQD